MKIKIPPVISLYSYKGGAGRTLCTANLVGLLAREIAASKAAPIVLLDMDLDSAGLTIMLDQPEAVGNKELNMSKIMGGKFSLRGNEKLSQLRRESITDISALVDAPEGSVLFIGAEPVGHKSEPKSGTMADVMVGLLEVFGAGNVSAVVMDCASGLQPVADLTRQLSNVIVYCCRLTGQFLWGTDRELKSFVGSNAAGEKPNIIVLPVAVPDPSKSELFKEYLRVAMSDLARLEMDLRKQANIFLLRPGICEVELFKWHEEVLSLVAKGGTLAQDESSALMSFHLLATKVAEMAGLASAQIDAASSQP